MSNFSSLWKQPNDRCVQLESVKLGGQLSRFGNLMPSVGNAPGLWLDYLRSEPHRLERVPPTEALLGHVRLHPTIQLPEISAQSTVWVIQCPWLEEAVRCLSAASNDARLVESKPAIEEPRNREATPGEASAPTPRGTAVR